MTAVAALSLLLVGCAHGSGSGSPDPPGAASETTSQTADPGSADRSSAATPSTRGAVSQPAEPQRLQIPAIEVDEQLIDLGLNPVGAMEVPEDPDRAGWFTGGGRPGGRGPTVLAGHVDSTDGPAVFGALGELDRGEEILVEDVDGRGTTYRIERVEDYPKGNFPTEEVFGAQPGDELRLITCTGEWDTAGSQYVDNKVVYATAVDRS